jgi:predicted phosphohydrolase
MKIQIISDLHLEGYMDPYKIVSKYIDTKDTDILILAGDIEVCNYMWTYNTAFDFFSENFKKTIYIPGNHEYYGKGFKKLSKTPFTENIRENVIFTNNNFFDIDGVRFICSTLWSDIDIRDQFQVQNGMHDYTYIKDQYNKLLLVDYVNEVYKDSKDFIFSNISNELKNVVVTHHAPVYDCISDYFKGNCLNSAFANRLDNEILNSNIDYWVYGHTHANVGDIQIGKTWITSNQLGYSREISKDFKPKFILI